MYKIIGSDQKIYGPISVTQLRQWVAEGRVNLGTLVQPEGGSEWRPLSTFPELAMPPPVSLPPSPATTDTNGMATAGLVFGVLANVCCCFGLVLGALGVIFSAIGLTHANSHPLRRGKGEAIAGLVLSILALIWHTFVPLLGLAFRPGMIHHHGLRIF